MAATHDIAYKQLFAHPCMVRELLSAVPGCRDLCSLPDAAFERVNGAHIGAGGQRRDEDMVWRIGEGTYLLLEFQSRPEHQMVLRMLGYACLFLQELAASRPATVPVVLPVVLLTGDMPWHAPLTLAELRGVQNEEFSAYQPELRIIALDQRDFGTDSLLGVRLERAGSSSQCKELAGHLWRLLAGRVECSLHTWVLEWIAQVLQCKQVRWEDVMDNMELPDDIRRPLRPRHEPRLHGWLLRLIDGEQPGTIWPD